MHPVCMSVRKCDKLKKKSKAYGNLKRDILLN